MQANIVHATPDDRTTMQRLSFVVLGLVGVMAALIVAATIISHLVH